MLHNSMLFTFLISCSVDLFIQGLTLQVYNCSDHSQTFLGAAKTNTKSEAKRKKYPTEEA